MKEIILENDKFDYRVYINNNINKFHNILLENKIKDSNSIFIITDENVYEAYEKVLKTLKNKNKYFVYVIESGEKNKNFNTISHIYDFLIKKEANRSSIIIALGGGIVGDIAGFVASTYMRGIGFINVPTTLLSQVDSCIGGKTGYNYKGIKNIIGNFYNPIFVYVSTYFLKTLNKEEFLAGFGEVIKYALIKDNNLFDFIQNNIKYIMEKEQDKLLHIVHECLFIKAKIVKEDFNDLGIRNSLNFGHTVGHAIEVSSNYEIFHGEAVALGILVSLKLSEKKLNLSKDVYNKVVDIYKKVGLPYKYKVDNYKSFMYAIKHDKKNTNKIMFVLLEKIGKFKIKVEINEKEIIEAMEESICKGEN
ncbi:3-dehydroquinate synthase [Clostridium niameyense]|uniref:3-dehydroquinate synthase n=1 Tax=Clostridium niameyense TaxID=1622073 RepID=UPI00067EC0B7|nr:3-dehydroquinate synthase [Clostridium niameyense]